MTELKQIVHEGELKGKTIERLGYLDNHLFFFFKDNTFCVCRGCGWEERDVELMGGTYDIKPNDYNLEDLFEIGILNEKEFSELKQQRQNKRDAIEKLRDLEKLEELKQKYNIKP